MSASERASYWSSEEYVKDPIYYHPYDINKKRYDWKPGFIFDGIGDGDANGNNEEGQEGETIGPKRNNRTVPDTDADSDSDE